MATVLDEIIYKVFGDKKRAIKLIQIGANDGIFEDPIYPHHVSGDLDFEWAQIFEPLPDYFEILKQNMSRFPYVHCHNQAVDGGAGRRLRKFSYVPISSVNDYNLPPSSKGLGSFSRDRNALGGLGYSEAKFALIKDHIQTIEVETIPVSEIISKFGDANLFVTDCEGYDIEVIEAAFSSGKFLPNVVQFEYLGHNDDLFRPVIQRVKDTGYQVNKVGKNIICELL